MPHPYFSFARIGKLATRFYPGRKARRGPYADHGFKTALIAFLATGLCQIAGALAAPLTPRPTPGTTPVCTSDTPRKVVLNEMKSQGGGAGLDYLELFVLDSVNLDGYTLWAYNYSGALPAHWQPGSVANTAGIALGKGYGCKNFTGAKSAFATCNPSDAGTLGYPAYALYQLPNMNQADGAQFVVFDPAGKLVDAISYDTAASCSASWWTVPAGCLSGSTCLAGFGASSSDLSRSEDGLGGWVNNGSTQTQGGTNAAGAPPAGAGYRFWFGTPASSCAGTTTTLALNAAWIDANGNFLATAPVPYVGYAGGANFSLTATAGFSVLPGAWSNGATTLTITSPPAGTLTLSAKDIRIPATLGSTSINFSACASSGFDALEPAAAASASALYTKLAGTAFDLDIMAIANPAYSGTPVVELVDAASAASCAAMTVISASSAPASGSAWAGGRRAWTFTSPRAVANARLRITDGATTSCSTDNFAIRPAGFVLAASNADATALPAPTLVAGGNDIRITAATNVAGYSGSAAVFPTLSRNTGNVALNNGGPTLTAADAANTPLTDPPAAGQLGFAVSTSTPGSGVLRYHDVGTLTLTVQDWQFTAVDSVKGDCLASSASNTRIGGKFGCHIGGEISLGRFIPAKFLLSGNFTPACGPAASGFTYMNEAALGVAITLRAVSEHSINAILYANPCPVSGRCALTLSANNGSGIPVDITRLGPLGDFPPGTTAIGSGSGSSYQNLVWANGSFVMNGGSFNFARLSAADGPYDNFTLQAAIDDPDGVGLSGASSLAPTRLRYGRLRLANAFGIETLPLAIGSWLEYFDSASQRWLPNTLDNCTTLASLGGPGAALPLTGLPATTATTTPRCGVASGIACSTSSGVACNSTATSSAGQLGICLTAPNAAGYADIVFTTLPAHLAGGGLGNSARASFGVYNRAGNGKKIIYRREVR